jgi:hypothetical protein
MRITLIVRITLITKMKECNQKEESFIKIKYKNSLITINMLLKRLQNIIRPISTRCFVRTFTITTVSTLSVSGFELGHDISK